MANTELDPRFFMPPSVVDLSYVDEQDVSSDYPEDTVEVDYDLATEVEYNDGTGAEDEGRLLPPDSITFVSQTSRVTTGGVVVDVIIDVEDSANITEYGVRVTKL